MQKLRSFGHILFSLHGKKRDGQETTKLRDVKTFGEKNGWEFCMAVAISPAGDGRLASSP